MKVSLRSAIATVILAFIAGVSGIWVGHYWLSPGPAQSNSLHAMVHEELALTPEQERHLEALETVFAARRQVLENEMRKANAELAAAIRASETAGPAVDAAVHHFHDAMGMLQTETINHVFAMRKVLTTDQRERFDDKIGQALTANAE